MNIEAPLAVVYVAAVMRILLLVIKKFKINIGVKFDRHGTLALMGSSSTEARLSIYSAPCCTMQMSSDSV